MVGKAAADPLPCFGIPGDAEILGVVFVTSGIPARAAGWELAPAAPSAIAAGSGQISSTMVSTGWCRGKLSSLGTLNKYL